MHASMPLLLQWLCIHMKLTVQNNKRIGSQHVNISLLALAQQQPVQ